MNYLLILEPIINRLYSSPSSLFNLHLLLLTISLIVFTLIPYKQQLEEQNKNEVKNLWKKIASSKRDIIQSEYGLMIAKKKKTLLNIFELFRSCAYLNLFSLFLMGVVHIFDFLLIKSFILLFTLIVLFGIGVNTHRLKEFYTQEIEEKIKAKIRTFEMVDELYSMKRYDLIEKALKENHQKKGIRNFLSNIIGKLKSFNPKN